LQQNYAVKIITGIVHACAQRLHILITHTVVQYISVSESPGWQPLSAVWWFAL